MRLPDSQRGFSLLEALITLAVLGIGMAGTAKLQSLVFSRMLDAKAQTEALQFATQEIEDLRYQACYQGAPASLPVTVTKAGLHGEYTLQAIEKSSDDQLVEIEQSASWQTPGSSGQLTINTYTPLVAYSSLLYRLD